MPRYQAVDYKSFSLMSIQPYGAIDPVKDSHEVNSCTLYFPLEGCEGDVANKTSRNLFSSITLIKSSRHCARDEMITDRGSERTK